MRTSNSFSSGACALSLSKLFRLSLELIWFRLLLRRGALVRFVVEGLLWVKEWLLVLDRVTLLGLMKVME
jgi:hypothetical protein